MTEMTAKLAADIPVPVGGFEWAGPELIAIGEPRHYNPFDETPGLFLTFADCEALDLCHTLGEKVPEGRWDEIRESALTFMSKYGQITSDDPLTHFAIAAMIMRGAVDLWEAVCQGDEEDIRKTIHWDAKRGCWDYSLSPLSVRVGDDWVDESDTFRNEGSLRGFAWALLTSFLHSYSYLRLRLAVKDGRPVLETRELEDVLYSQLLLAVAADKFFRQCLSCDKYFEVPNPTHSKSRRYCSNTCRVRHFQRRQAEAKRRLAEGQSAVEIAQNLDLNVDTIKKWNKSND